MPKTTSDRAGGGHAGRIAALAWAGQPKQAIEAATAALATDGPGAARGIDLPGPRAESALVEATMRVEPRW